MAKRVRPRVDRAHRSASPHVASLEEAEGILWDNFPAIMQKSVELALAGNAQVHVAILRIAEKMMLEDKPRRGTEIMKEVRRIREQALSQSGVDIGEGRPETDLGPAGGDGPLDPDARRPPLDLVSD